MKVTLKKLVIFLPMLLNISIGTARADEKPQVETSIDWEHFLSRHDLLWSRMPKEWNEAPFLGNGMMGTMVMQADEQSVRWEVGRGDVQDHRPAGKKFGYDTCRLPIGRFELKTVGKIIGGTIRLDLWNAEGTGQIQTDQGSIRWQIGAHGDHYLARTL